MKIPEVISPDSECYHKKIVKSSTVLRHLELLLRMVQIHNHSEVTAFSCTCKFIILNETRNSPAISFPSLLNLPGLASVTVVHSSGWISRMFNNNSEIKGNKKSKFRTLYNDLLSRKVILRQPCQNVLVPSKFPAYVNYRYYHNHHTGVTYPDS